MHRGYLPIWRKFFEEHRFWQEKRKFSRAEAWIDILRNTHYKHEPKQRLIRGRLITINYGECVLTTRYCGQAWGWHNSAVHRFFNLLKKMEQIDIKLEQQMTHVTVLNFSKYDIRRNSDGTKVEQQRNSDGTVTERTKEHKNIRTKEQNKEIYSRVVDYLNVKTGKKFSPKTKNTRSHINARLSEGHTEDDFKTVIDKKTAKWLNDPKMSEFLRPQTLFGTKFESYLNEKPVVEDNRFSDTTKKTIETLKDWRPG